MSPENTPALTPLPQPAGPTEFLATWRATSADRYPDAPPTPSGIQWFYHPADYPAALLHAIVMRGRAATNVDYASTYARPAATLWLRLAAPEGSGSGRAGRPRVLRAFFAGQGRLTSGEGKLEASMADDAATLRLDGSGPWVVQIEAPKAADATSAGAALGLADADGLTVEASHDGEAWVPARKEEGDHEPPHQREEPTVPLTAVFGAACAADGKSSTADLGLPGLGRLTLTLPGEVRDAVGNPPRLAMGETPDEAHCPPEQAENRATLEACEGGWRSTFALAGRYLRLAPAIPGAQARMEAHIHPVAQRGAFACSDPHLTAIWDRSAFTLRLCLQRLALDGIKRDRMPWAGDQALNTLANAYTLADRQVVLDGWRALGRPSDGLINGTLTYSLWWMINGAEFHRYFGAGEELPEIVEAMAAMLDRLSERLDESTGILRGDTSADPTWVFVDWGYDSPRDEDSCVLQMLWLWALRESCALMRDVGGRWEQTAARWEAVAARVQATLESRAWDETVGAWRDELPSAAGQARHTAYAQFLATLAGLDGDRSAHRGHATVEETHTPFMRGMALRSLLARGERERVVAQVREAWSGMLLEETSTFWEEFAPQEGSPWSMYGRPFGKSLCHAWSSGPAVLLPQAILGVEPLAAGWSQVRVDPHLGGLEWAAASVPTPHGQITVIADSGRTRVWIHDGVQLQVPQDQEIEVLAFR